MLGNVVRHCVCRSVIYVRCIRPFDQLFYLNLHVDLLLPYGISGHAACVYGASGVNTAA